jgi:hypothetical protein
VLSCGEKVVSIVTCGFGRCEARGSHESGQNLELFDKLIIKDGRRIAISTVILALLAR